MAAVLDFTIMPMLEETLLDTMKAELDQQYPRGTLLRSWSRIVPGHVTEKFKRQARALAVAAGFRITIDRVASFFEDSEEALPSTRVYLLNLRGIYTEYH